jgi:hypothetical protein
MQPLENIDHDLIVEDFDRLLELYRFVEGEEERPSAADAIAPTFYTASSKPTRPASFFRAVQDEARTPTTLEDLTLRLQAMNRTKGGNWLVPRSSEDHDLVIQIRTRYAATHGCLEPAGLHDILPELASCEVSIGCPSDREL